MNILFIRAIERIIAVLIGGFAIYLGYMLFINMPELVNSEGNMQLPGGISVYMSRVGPGAFFALFGSVVVCATFYFQLKSSPGAEPSGIENPASGNIVYMLGNKPAMDKQMIDFERSLVRKDIRTLSRLMTSMENAGNGNAVAIEPETRTDFAIALPRMQAAMMSSIWDEDMGDYVSFSKWMKEGAAGVPPSGTEKAAEYIQS